MSTAADAASTVVALPCQRDLFELPDDLAYLNCAFMAPQLRGVTEAGVAAVRRKAAPWTLKPADFFDDLEVARDLVARLVGGDADGVAVVPSASYGLSLAAANLPIPPGRTVVVLAEQYPSNVYPWRDAVARGGGRLVSVARPADGDWTAAVLAAIDDATAVVAVPNCHWTDGGLLDLGRVGHAARARGAALVVDATQSLGALPFDVRTVQPDFLVAAGYKWLLGPYSLGFCWVAPHRRDGRPLEFHWAGRAGSEDFARLVEYTDALRPGARRYDVGEASNFVLLPMALAALRRLLDWGVAAVAATIAPLCDAVAAGATAAGAVVAPAALRAPHIVGLRLPGGPPPDLASRLADANVVVSLRGDAVRVSPHVYNTAADVERFLAVLRAAL